jgi:hypothetical protein
MPAAIRRWRLRSELEVVTGRRSPAELACTSAQTLHRRMLRWNIQAGQEWSGAFEPAHPLRTELHCALDESPGNGGTAMAASSASVHLGTGIFHHLRPLLVFGMVMQCETRAMLPPGVRPAASGFPDGRRVR